MIFIQHDKNVNNIMIIIILILLIIPAPGGHAHPDRLLRHEAGGGRGGHATLYVNVYYITA